jgi:chondroitin 4-sulfotransferase 11
MISHEHKCIFIHIPKTGGTSIELLFDPKANKRDVKWKHYTSSEFKRDTPRKFKTYYKFSIVRNPWALCYSMYNYMWNSNKFWPRKERERKKKNGNSHVLGWSFKQWILSDEFQGITPDTRSVFQPFGGRKILPHKDQFDWIYKGAETIVLDKLCRTETLDKDFQDVCGALGIKAQEVPHANKSLAPSYTEVYNEEMINVVFKKFKRDVVFFGYSFE